jgi:hypothetical protein
VRGRSGSVIEATAIGDSTEVVAASTVDLTFSSDDDDDYAHNEYGEEDEEDDEDESETVGAQGRKRKYGERDEDDDEDESETAGAQGRKRKHGEKDGEDVMDIWGNDDETRVTKKALRNEVMVRVYDDENNWLDGEIFGVWQHALGKFFYDVTYYDKYRGLAEFRVPEDRIEPFLGPQNSPEARSYEHEHRTCYC